MSDRPTDAEELNDLLDGVLSGGGTGSRESAAFDALRRADAAIPGTDAHFRESLRASLMTWSPARPAGTGGKPVGIVARPLPARIVRPLVPGAFMPIAAAVAVLLALFAFNAGWTGGGNHGFGIPTAMASSTVEPATPTPAATPSPSRPQIVELVVLLR